MKPAILILCSLSLVMADCYTVIESQKQGTRPLTERERELKEFLSWGIVNDYDLLGVWENSQMRYDYGDRIKRLQLNSEGTLYYYPTAEVPNGRIMRGRYRVREDTLWVYYDDHYLLEKYHYTIDQKRIWFSTINENKNEPYSITDDNAPVWGRVEGQ